MAVATYSLGTAPDGLTGTMGRRTVLLEDEHVTCDRLDITKHLRKQDIMVLVTFAAGSTMMDSSLAAIFGRLTQRITPNTLTRSSMHLVADVTGHQLFILANQSRASKAFIRVYVRVYVCSHDRTKTAETTIAKLATAIVHYEFWLYLKVKGHRIIKCKTSAYFGRSKSRSEFVLHRVATSLTISSKACIIPRRAKVPVYSACSVNCEYPLRIDPFTETFI